ncbi:murein biosynthesis integral membrane protein MurJ [Dactylosporangium matsuzakiense]|uniref:murein biosynthesis integral membrane protein MurJ n=1 Tax=Dactylosporangium matsuzakiense TaxID=53360 RepID=UPI0021C2D124|nr:murein biosynthesis integral membrane protein MurJ [Dactylosporangium matsuzakiense]
MAPGSDPWEDEGWPEPAQAPSRQPADKPHIRRRGVHRRPEEPTEVLPPAPEAPAWADVQPAGPTEVIPPAPPVQTPPAQMPLAPTPPSWADVQPAGPTEVIPPPSWAGAPAAATQAVPPVHPAAAPPPSFTPPAGPPPTFVPPTAAPPPTFAPPTAAPPPTFALPAAAHETPTFAPSVAVPPAAAFGTPAHETPAHDPLAGPTQVLRPPAAGPVDPGQTVRLEVGRRPEGLTVDPANAPTMALPLLTPRPQVVADAPQVEESVPPSAADDDSTGTVVRNSSTMAILSLVSRATGFLRAAAIAAAIGGAVVGDDYTLANNLPNQVYELLLGGVLASVLIPTLVRARKDDPDRGEAHAQRLLTLAAVALGIATVLVVLAAPLITAVYTLGNDKVTTADRDLITLLAYLLLPEIFFYGLAGISAAILNVRGHFAAPMWTPILNNIVVIATGGVFMLISDGVPKPDTITMPQVLVLGIGTTLGIIVQAAGLWPAMRKTGFRWKWRFDFRKLHLRELAKLGAWMLLYVGVNQLGITVVMALAKQTQLQGGQGPAVFNNAFLIFMMAHGIVAVSVITAIMPRISAAAADGRFSDVTDQLAQASRLASVILIPAAAVYVVLGKPLAVTLFNHGSYTYDQALATGSVVAAAGLGLLPFALSQMQTSVFYATRDTKTPALVNIGGVAVRLLLDVTFYFVLPVAVVTTSLMVGTALSYVATLIVGYVLLRKRLGRLGLRRLLDTLIRLAAAAVVGGLLALGVTWLIGLIIDPGWLLGVVQLIFGSAVLVAVYAVGAIFLKVPEVSQFAGMIRRRLGR